MDGEYLLFRWPSHSQAVLQCVVGMDGDLARALERGAAAAGQPQVKFLRDALRAHLTTTGFLSTSSARRG